MTSSETVTFGVATLNMASRIAERCAHEGWNMGAVERFGALCDLILETDEISPELASSLRERLIVVRRLRGDSILLIYIQPALEKLEQIIEGS